MVLTSTYQLDASEAADSQRVDDVEVLQLQAGEEGVLRLVPGDTQTQGGLH